MRAGNKVVGIVQARLSSTRLPAKILAPVAGRPLLQVLFERVRRARVDAWWLATSSEPDDEVTAAWGAALGMQVFRGDLDDVLSRFCAILRREQPEWMVRLTADDPFTDAGVVDELLAQAARMPADHVVMSEDPRRRTLPLGYAPQVARAAEVVEAEARIPAGVHHRAHVLSLFYDEGRFSRLEPPPRWPARPDWRWTVDTRADLEMAGAAFRELGQAWRDADYPRMVAALSAAPHVTSINLHVRQKQSEEG